MATCRQTPLHVNKAFYLINTFPTQGCAVATRRPSVLGPRMQQVRSLSRLSRTRARLPALSGALSGAVLTNSICARRQLFSMILLDFTFPG